MASIGKTVFPTTHIPEIMTIQELQELCVVDAHDEPAWSISLHSKLPILATSSSDKKSKIYDIRDALQGKVELVNTLDEETHSKTIRSVCFKPSQEESYPTLALGSFDSTCSIWGADSIKTPWELLAVIEGHENEVKSVDWSLDGKYLATCARDKTIWVWETDSMNEEFECISVLSEHEADVKFVKWNDKDNSDDGRDTHLFMSCSYDDTLRIWRQDEYDEDEWNCVAIIRFESTVWSAAWVDSYTIVCSTDDGEVMMYTRPNDSVNVNGETEADKLPSTIKKIEEWNINRNFQGEVGRIHQGAVYSVASKDGKIVSGGSDGVITLYSTESGKWNVTGQKRLSHGVREVNCVQLGNINGETVIASCGDDGKVRIWKQ